MHESTTRGLGSAPGQVPANKGRRYRAEVLSRAEADALIAAGPAASRTGIRNRALITLAPRRLACLPGGRRRGGHLVQADRFGTGLEQIEESPVICYHFPGDLGPSDIQADGGPDRDGRPRRRRGHLNAPAPTAHGSRRLGSLGSIRTFKEAS